MKTKQLCAALLLATGIFTGNAQTNVATSSITSRGLDAGTSGNGNAFFGYRAGRYSLITNSFSYSTFIGHLSGSNMRDGYSNTFIGYKSGESNTDGLENVFIGNLAGSGSSESARNVLIGYGSGLTNNGNDNVLIGYKSGYLNDKSGNIFIGKESGYNELGSDKLYIENSNIATPLIWGDFQNDLLKFNGKVGIGLYGTTFPATAGGVAINSYQLFVKGGILTEELRVVAIDDWADYVFEDGYKLRTLAEVECYIEENGHLPNVPSAKQVESEGFEVGQMAKIQQEKIEELTLYLIEQNKQLETQDKKIERQEKENGKMAGMLIEQNTQLEKQQREIDELKALVQALTDKK